MSSENRITITLSKDEIITDLQCRLNMMIRLAQQKDAEIKTLKEKVINQSKHYAELKQKKRKLAFDLDESNKKIKLLQDEHYARELETIDIYEERLDKLQAKFDDYKEWSSNEMIRHEDNFIAALNEAEEWYQWFRRENTKLYQEKALENTWLRNKIKNWSISEETVKAWEKN